MEYRKATELLLNGHPQDCIEFFKTNNNSLEYAYALLLTSRIKESKYVVEQQDSVRSDWLKKLLLVLEGEIVYPTYFQIRNFLEIDLSNQDGLIMLIFCLNKPKISKGLITKHINY